MAANKGDKLKSIKSKLAGAAFTVALIGICLLLFLLSDVGSNFFSKPAANKDADVLPTEEPIAAATEEPSAAPEETPRINLPDTDVFFERLHQLGFKAELKLVEENARMLAYEFDRGDYAPGGVVLSLRNGKVCAFTIDLPCAGLPRKPGSDASEYDQMVYAVLSEAYYADMALVANIFRTLVFALDVGDVLAYPRVDALAEQIGTVTNGGEPYRESLYGFTFSVTRDTLSGQNRIKISFLAE